MTFDEPSDDRAEPAVGEIVDLAEIGLSGPTGALGEGSEDAVKKHLKLWLEQQGWSVKVAWGKTRGVDIEATKSGSRWLIEVKGIGSLQPMRVNYFIGMLGETLQRMDDPKAAYSIALPDHPQYRGLWNRLPELAKKRTQITMLFVAPNGRVEHNLA